MLADVPTSVFGFDLTIGVDLVIQYYSSDLTTIGVFVKHSSSGNEHYVWDQITSTVYICGCACACVRVRACVCVSDSGPVRV